MSDAETLQTTEEELTPSYHGELCRYNGENPDYEIACDECDYYLTCFPDWEDMMQQPGTTQNI